MTLGTGKYTYERVDGWGDLPEGWEWGQVGSVAVDSKDRVYVYTRTDHPLMIFERDGSFVRSWGEGIVSDAHGICLDAQDNLFLVDRNAQVAVKFTANGDKVFELGNRDQPSDSGWTDESRTVLRAADPFHHPTDIALSANGDVYVSDGYRNARVHKFSAQGELLFSWGQPGKTGPGEFHVPHGVWVHTDGRVFVADRENNRIQIFSASGEYLDQWPGLARPCDIYIDHDNVLYVPELDGFMSILSIDGDIIATWGSPLDAGWGKGAHAIWVDSHGDLYVNQNVEGHRLVKYLRQ